MAGEREGGKKGGRKGGREEGREGVVVVLVIHACT